MATKQKTIDDYVGEYDSHKKYLEAKKKHEVYVAKQKKIIKSYQESIDITRKKIKEYEKKRDEAVQAIAIYRNTFGNDMTTWPSGVQASYAAYKKQFDENEALISKAHDDIKVFDTRIKEAEAHIKSSNDKWNKKTHKTPDNKYNNNQDTAIPTPGKGPWFFNAPPTFDTNFLNFNSLMETVGRGEAVQGDATTFWKSYYTYNETSGKWNSQTWGGKGAIQMDRQTNTVELAANAKKEIEKANKENKTSLKFDDKMYGFKFQYNPTTISMNWVGMTGANPVYEMTAANPAAPMSKDLITGTITFEIILNRISDLAQLRHDGEYVTANPYAIDVPLSERQKIVDKGTMYDLDYLFRAMHGYAQWTNYRSTLMGETSDPGWLPFRPVEVILGNKLMYRARISNLQVEHKIFTNRMVPILSVVSITCNRYWDMARAEKKK